jgi:pimeloyl-ACP methyl ester carboxylesterase
MRVLVNGVRLFVDVEGAKSVPDGRSMREKPTVVLLHGGPGFDHSSFKPEFSQLADTAQLVYFDHRGNGRSDRDDPKSWNLDAWADDVKGLCDALEIEQPIVLGWSFGASVAIKYAARHPGHPAKLILQSPTARMDVERIVAAFETIGGGEPATAARAFWTNPNDETMAGYVQHCIPLYSSEPLDARMGRSVLNIELLKGFEGQMEMDLREELGQVRIPVLVLAGRIDPIMPLSAAEEVVEALSGADVTLEVFDHSSHFIHFSEPEWFFSVVRSFVEGPEAD